MSKRLTDNDLVRRAKTPLDESDWAAKLER